jgi:hypothetical protein
MAAADHANVDNAHIIHQTNRPHARLTGGGSRRNRLPRSFPQESLPIISAPIAGVKGEDGETDSNPKTSVQTTDSINPSSR